MKLLDDYFALQEKVHGFFGYVEDWRILPLEDRREMYWTLPDGEGYGGIVKYAENPDDLHPHVNGDYYEDEIYTQRHLPKWVYRAEGYTMICVDTHTDGNQLLVVYDNAKELK